MINVYRSMNGDCSLNEFCNRKKVKMDEVIIRSKTVFGKSYRYAEPTKEGVWAFGGNFLYTSNGIYPDFQEPVKLHDRNMILEV